MRLFDVIATVLTSRDSAFLVVGWTNQVESYLFAEMRIILFPKTCDCCWFYFVHEIVKVQFIAVILEIFRVSSAL